jgi:4-diphosphocytidyl-2-C-methyl-D-erythritol kinase
MADSTIGSSTDSARAKINLYLHVVGRRDDGYHLLDSLVAFADVADTLRVEPAESLTLTIDGPYAARVPGGADNLVLRAARAIADAAGISPRARIRLTKRLPVEAGIGGGSADAAAAMRLLRALWRVEMDPAQLRRVAIGLGADVPVCLEHVPVFVGGIGEEITPAPQLPAAWLVLANPGVAVATPEVFRRRVGAFAATGRFSAAPAGAQALAAVLAERRNDLTEAAVRIAPAIAGVLAELAALPSALLARMSGSGATCFALFADRNHAESAARQLNLRNPGWWVAAAPMLTAGRPEIATSPEWE